MKPDKAQAKQTIHELYNSLGDNPAPEIADIREALLKVYNKTDQLDNIEPIYSRLVNLIYSAATVAPLGLSRDQERLVRSLADIGKRAGPAGGAFMAYGNKDSF
ncbi:bacteriocin immunity protein [Loigolactobacillus zhaoyuanensis]|uniref:Bacteriocin immunity protein n=1 Tax=Loigolactobacillus zhaoyuanensis TaxID=2486017 RepID=A0ABW8UDE8_9LACO|nr:bacteriocin immunity protein [Loigolactobacillus zhaoyuanensis]